MPTNRISAALPDANKTAAIDFIKKAKDLLPFLIALQVDERKKLRKMGPKSVQYVNLNLQGATNFPESIPSSVDVPEFGKDVALITALWDIRVPLAALLEGIDDTMMAAGIDSIETADKVYGFLKVAGKSNGAVKALLAEIKKRFEGQGRKKTPPKP